MARTAAADKFLGKGSAGIYLFKVNNGNIRKNNNIKDTGAAVFIVDFEQVNTGWEAIKCSPVTIVDYRIWNMASRVNIFLSFELHVI